MYVFTIGAMRSIGRRNKKKMNQHKRVGVNTVYCSEFRIYLDFQRYLFLFSVKIDV